MKIRKKMEDGTFFRAFCEKEKFAALLAQIPIQMVLNEEAPLIGAMSASADPVSGAGIFFESSKAGRGKSVKVLA